MTDTITNIAPDEIDALTKHAKIVAASGLVPEHFKKYPQAVYTAVGLAKSMGEDPVYVMQSIYFTSGKPGWTSAFLLARLRRTKTIRGTVRALSGNAPIEDATVTGTAAGQDDLS